MNSVLIVLLGLWLYPILSGLFVRVTRRNPNAKRVVFLTLLVLTLICVMGLGFNISSISDTLDWIVLTIPYLLLCYALWHLFFVKKRIFKYISIVLMVVVYGLGYFVSTVGILGIGFFVTEYEYVQKISIDKNLIYKEYTLGNALSDYRGKKVEVHQTINGLPLEWKVKDTSYYNIVVYKDRLKVDYDSAKKQLYLSANYLIPDTTFYWKDSLNLDF